MIMLRSLTAPILTLMLLVSATAKAQTAALDSASRLVTATGPTTKAQTVDWGTISTEINDTRSFAFAQYDVAKNFTHSYAFSLEGSASSTYKVSFAVDTCRTGCGSPDFSYGISPVSGRFISDSNGTVALTAGSYVFEVKGTGMGAGNSIDYWGSVNFSVSPSNMAVVSPVPEPSTVILTFFGALFLALAAAPRQILGLLGRLVGRDVATLAFGSRAAI